MIGTTASTPRRPLFLTEQEAMALLEMCLLTPIEEKETHAGALLHLSDLCREFLRARPSEMAATRWSPPRFAGGPVGEQAR